MSTGNRQVVSLGHGSRRRGWQWWHLGTTLRWRCGSDLCHSWQWVPPPRPCLALLCLSDAIFDCCFTSAGGTDGFCSAARLKATLDEGVTRRRLHWAFGAEHPPFPFPFPLDSSTHRAEEGWRRPQHLWAPATGRYRAALRGCSQPRAWGDRRSWGQGRIPPCSDPCLWVYPQGMVSVAPAGGQRDPGAWPHKSHRLRIPMALAGGCPIHTHLRPKRLICIWRPLICSRGWLRHRPRCTGEGAEAPGDLLLEPQTTPFAQCPGWGGPWAAEGDRGWWQVPRCPRCCRGPA